VAEYERTLRWLEPFGGWRGFTTDTGLCNRIFHWEVAYEINKQNDFKYYILLEEKYWPENKLIDLPTTKTISNIEGDPHDVEKLKFIAVYDTINKKINTAKPLYSDNVEKMFREGNLKIEDKGHFYSNFGYKELSNLYLPEVFEKIERPLSKIKLKHRSVEESIINEMKNVVGIHIRRGNGVPYTVDDLNTLPENKRDKFSLIKRAIAEQSHWAYSFHRDDLYFNIMDNMLKINPNQKFYISTDVPDDIMDYFYNRYKNNLIDKTFLLNVVYDYILNSGFKKSDFVYGNVVENLVDLFSLSYTSFLVKAPTSTWSIFAENYTKKESVFVTDDWEKTIREKYVKTLKIT
jgi:hypothetical protein